MTEPGSIQDVDCMCCVCMLLWAFWYTSGMCQHCYAILSLQTYYFMYVCRSVMGHYSEYNNCNSIYMLCPCSDSTSALKSDSVHCTQEAVGMPVMKFIDLFQNDVTASHVLYC